MLRGAVLAFGGLRSQRQVGARCFATNTHVADSGESEKRELEKQIARMEQELAQQQQKLRDLEEASNKLGLTDQSMDQEAWAKQYPLFSATNNLNLEDGEDEHAFYVSRAERMVRRWSGGRSRVRSKDSETPYVSANFANAVKTTPAVAIKEKTDDSTSSERLAVVEPARALQVLAECDVLVVGGGPAGLSAALGARRAGADVILLERFGCFGGVITTVGMETLGWYRYEGQADETGVSGKSANGEGKDTGEGDSMHVNDVEGIGTEMERMAERMGGSTKWPYNDSQCLDAEQFKLVADTLVRESGVRPLLHSWAVAAIRAEGDGGAVRGVVVESKSGRHAVLAQRVVDCTGDADVASFAQAAYETCPVDERMSVTPVFNCAGVDKERFLRYTEENPTTYQDWSRTWQQETSGKEDHLRTPYLDREFVHAREMGALASEEESRREMEERRKQQELGLARAGAGAQAGAEAQAQEQGQGAGEGGTGPTQEVHLGGTWSALSDAGEATNLNLVNLTGYDCTNVVDLTQAEMEGRAQTVHAITALRATVPGFEQAKLRNFGMTMGTRDSRKIVGRYNLSAEDVYGEARFDDAVGMFPEFIDGYNILVLPTTGRYFQVPYGCLVPVGVDNLLVAGRCVAGDKVSHAAMRNMMACTVTGQGAGVAAAVSVRTGKSTNEVDISQVQAELARQGVRLG